MGLRERNAAATREHILATALPLFLEQGYEATRMEEIAERAEVGTSTLYRYFPAKDALILEPLSLRGQMSDELDRRPPQEPLDVALGHALVAMLDSPRADPARLRQVHAVLETSPSLQGRLLEEFLQERGLLERAVAARLGRPEDDVFSIVTARLATVILELAAEGERNAAAQDLTSATEQVLERTRAILACLEQEPPVVPRLEA